MAEDRLRLEYVPLDRAAVWDRNPKRHDLGALAESIRRYGFKDPPKFEPELNGGGGGIVEGNGRVLALREMKDTGEDMPRGLAGTDGGGWAVPVLFGVDAASREAAEAYGLDHNSLVILSSSLEGVATRVLYDDNYIALLKKLTEAEVLPVSMDDSLVTWLAQQTEELPDYVLNRKTTGKLAERFIVSPFSILDSRLSTWQERKRMWVSIGSLGALGRNENLLGLDRINCANVATSLFDPVLCELVYSWFCLPEGRILDPFAGGVVRGIVASLLGRYYYGIDLSEEQIVANEVQARGIMVKKPVWIVGDSRALAQLVDGPFDLIFTCPPYFDLEIYSDDERDLSNQISYEVFLEDYRVIMRQAIDLLCDNRFACIVVSNIRDKKGFYHNFVGDTIALFTSLGARFYNEAIFVESYGSLPLRVSRLFSSGRKLGKMHQNLLVFCKGDPKIATQELGPIMRIDSE